MPAQLLVSLCPLPVISDGRLATKEEALPVLHERIAALTDSDVEFVGELLEEVGELAGRDEVAQRLGELVSELLVDASPFRPDLTTITGADDRLVLLTAGPSAGDDPTDAYRGIAMLERSGITDLPIDGHPLNPKRLRRSIEAYATTAGRAVDPAAMAAAVDAYSQT